MAYISDARSMQHKQIASNVSCCRSATPCMRNVVREAAYSSKQSATATNQNTDNGRFDRVAVVPSTRQAASPVTATIVVYRAIINRSRGRMRSEFESGAQQNLRAQQTRTPYAAPCRWLSQSVDRPCNPFELIRERHVRTAPSGGRRRVERRL